jgi:hypothetical protein
MAKVVLTNQLTLTVNGTDLSDHVAAFTVNVSADAVESNNFNTQYRERLMGLRDGEVTISFHNDYVTGSVNRTLGTLFTAGSYATVVATGTLGGTSVAGTAVCLPTSLTPIGAAIGDLMVMDVTWPTVGSVTGWGL